MEVGLIAAIAIVVGVGGIVLWKGWLNKSRGTTAVEPTALERKQVKGLGIFNALKRTRDQGNLLAAAHSWEELEELLLGVDVTFPTIEYLKRQVGSDVSTEESTTRLKAAIRRLLSTNEISEPNHKPHVIMVVGVNGVGKTTSVGKLAKYYTQKGKKVLIVAADTFRAAASSQLQTWAERSGSSFVSGKEGSDPGAVAFDGVKSAIAKDFDVVLVDTAGRLHTKNTLMDELKKIQKVIGKVIPEAPHETILVIDGTLGKNSLVQAKEFNDALDLAGFIVTKLDGSAKGGIVLSIAHEMNLRPSFVGIGEGLEDLIAFDPNDFSEALFGTESQSLVH